MAVKRVLIVTSNFGGGTGVHVAGLLEHVDRRKWAVEVLSFGSVDARLPEWVRVVEARPTGKLDRFPFTQLRQIRQFRRMIGTTPPDIVHVYFIWPIIYARLLKRAGAIPHLVENREDEGFNLAPWERWFLRISAALPDRIVCVSEAVKGVVLDREGVEGDRVQVIRNGVRLPELSADLDDVEVLRREFGFSRDDLIVGMVANLNRPVKGGSYFIEAIPSILAQVPHARFLVVGGGKGTAESQRRARELGVGDRLVFAGFRSDIHRFYRLMDVSVLTSLSEGLSITLLESMGHGLPVVATRVGGNSELVAHGETGLLVPPAEPEPFAAAVAELLASSDLRRRMGHRGRERVIREFGLPAVAARYEATYAELLGASGGMREPRDSPKASP